MSRIPELAVILAAGLGTRLGSMGRQIPKGFLQLGSRPIIEESIGKLREAGIPRVLIVTGHLAGHYRELASRYPGVIELVHNERYSSTGSLASLACAARACDRDFLLLESDLIYERRALTECLGGGEDVVLVSGPTRSRDEVWVQAAGGYLEDMSKDRSRLVGDVVGELVGITRISAGLARLLVRIAEERSADPTGAGAHYETDGLVRAARERAIEVHLVPDLAWAEIDDAGHLSRARDEVYPRIQARDAKWPAPTRGAAPATAEAAESAPAALSRSGGGTSEPGPRGSRGRSGTSRRRSPGGGPRARSGR